jgi:acetamidase/formamidase
MPRTHHLSDERVHYKWDTRNEPVLTVESGDTVVVWTRDVSDNQIGPDSDVSALAAFDWDRAPQFRTPAPLTPRVDSAPFYGTTGVNGDLYTAAQDAIRAMIDYLGNTYALSREDAYLLCSLAVDLKISEIVDGGQYIVSALLPEATFSASSAATNGAAPRSARVPAAATA